METHAAVINLWPTVKAYADAVGADAKLTSVWKHRNSIPPEYWERTASAATAIGHSAVTVALLAAIRLARKNEAA